VGLRWIDLMQVKTITNLRKYIWNVKKNSCCFSIGAWVWPLELKHKGQHTCSGWCYKGWNRRWCLFWSSKLKILLEGNWTSQFRFRGYRRGEIRKLQGATKESEKKKKPRTKLGLWFLELGFIWLDGLAMGKQSGAFVGSF